MIATKQTVIKKLAGGNGQALIYSNPFSVLTIEVKEDDNNFELFERLLKGLNIEVKEELKYE